MLLVSVWWRLLVAGVAVAALWALVLWVLPSVPSISPAQPSVRVAAPPIVARAPASGGLRAIVRSGLPAPGGGRFDRFDVTAQPVAAPVNARGQVAFYATVLRSPAREGIFIADGAQVTKMAGGRATEGVFLAGSEGLRAIALAGDDAPGLPGGVLVGFDAPSLNDNDELAFVASVRRGRDTLDVLYFWNRQRLQRVAAEGDRLLRIGGTMDKIGGPALNNGGVIAFPAT